MRERSNQMIELTVSRRTILLYMATTISAAAALAAAHPVLVRPMRNPAHFRRTHV